MQGSFRRRQQGAKRAKKELVVAWNSGRSAAIVLGSIKDLRRFFRFCGCGGTEGNLHPGHLEWLNNEIEWCRKLHGERMLILGGNQITLIANAIAKTGARVTDSVPGSIEQVVEAFRAGDL